MSKRGVLLERQVTEVQKYLTHAGIRSAALTLPGILRE